MLSLVVPLGFLGHDTTRWLPVSVAFKARETPSPASWYHLCGDGFFDPKNAKSAVLSEKTQIHDFGHLLILAHNPILAHNKSFWNDQP